MSTAFGLYVVFTAYLIRHHHNHNLEQVGRFGPGAAIQDNDEILRAHIQRLREMQQLQHSNEEKQVGTNQLLREPMLSKAKVGGDTALHVHVVSADVVSTPKQQPASLTLEEVDIHDMKHPKEIHKEPIKVATTASVTTTAAKPTTSQQNSTQPAADKSSTTSRILKAYLEPIYLSDWDVKPLPVRKTSQDQLHVIEYPRVNSCQRLPELWPIDDFPDADPFLP